MSSLPITEQHVRTAARDFLPAQYPSTYKDPALAPPTKVTIATKDRMEDGGFTAHISFQGSDGKPAKIADITVRSGTEAGGGAVIIRATTDRTMEETGEVICPFAEIARLQTYLHRRFHSVMSTPHPRAWSRLWDITVRVQQQADIKSDNAEALVIIASAG